MDIDQDFKVLWVTMMISTTLYLEMYFAYVQFVKLGNEYVGPSMQVQALGPSTTSIVPTTRLSDARPAR